MKRVVVLILLLCISFSVSFAQRSNLKNLERQRKLALQDIENTTQLLKDTKSTTSTLLGRIKLISTQIETRQRVVSLLEQEIESIGVEEQKIGDEIGVLSSELEIKKDAYYKAVTSVMRNRQNDNKLLFVLSGRSLTESYRRFKYLKDYSEWRKRQAEDIISRNKQLALKQDSLNLAKVEKQSLLDNRETEQQKLKQEETNYQQEVKLANEKEKDLQKILDQKRRQAKALDQQIERLIAEEVARQEKKAQREKVEADRKAKVEADSKPKSKVPTTAANKPKDVVPKAPTPSKPESVVSTRENITLSSNFESNRGKLPYPISGRYTITSRFGTHKQSRWVTTNSSGIDIQSQANAQAKAVFSGEVTSIVSFPGYGNCILVRHGNYYTFYGNIQDIAVKKGERVATGQTLGTIFTDPDTKTAQLHFQLWQRKTKLNPEPWLRR